jgi:hypothetical protein
MNTEMVHNPPSICWCPPKKKRIELTPFNDRTLMLEEKDGLLGTYKEGRLKIISMYIYMKDAPSPIILLGSTKKIRYLL